METTNSDTENIVRRLRRLAENLREKGDAEKDSSTARDYAMRSFAYEHAADIAEEYL